MAAKRRNVLKAVCLGECQGKDLPSELDLSSIATEMSRLWQRSIRDLGRGVVAEFGATLVWEGSRLCLTNIVKGTSGTVTPKFKARAGQRFVGTFHTHPYKEGLLGVAFSGDDFASAINILKKTFQLCTAAARLQH